MPTTTESAAATPRVDPPSDLSSAQTAGADTVRDIYLWRRWQLSATLVLVTTATWLVMQVYHFNFLTVSSWLAIFIVSSLFIWGNIHRLLRKEEPDLSRLVVEEQTAMEVANSVREWVEEGVRWMLRIGAEKEWFLLAATVAALWLLSVIGSCSDLLNLVYFGNLVGMIGPAIYVRYDYKFNEYWERLKSQGNRIYSMFHDKVILKLKNKTGGGSGQLKKQA